MGRLIEVEDPASCASPLALRVGDVLLVRAPGGRVHSGAGAVELLGPYLPAVVGSDGSVVSPLGPPTTFLVRARQPGRARIDVVTGDPFHAPGTTALRITVAP